MASTEASLSRALGKEALNACGGEEGNSRGRHVSQLSCADPEACHAQPALFRLLRNLLPALSKRSAAAHPHGEAVGLAVLQ